MTSKETDELVTTEVEFTEAIVAELMDYFDPLGGTGVALTEAQARLIAFAARDRLQRVPSQDNRNRETTGTVLRPWPALL